MKVEGDRHLHHLCPIRHDLPHSTFHHIFHFTQSFLNNIKKQLKKTHIGFDNHRDIYLCRGHVKNATKRSNQKATTPKCST